MKYIAHVKEWNRALRTYEMKTYEVTLEELDEFAHYEKEDTHGIEWKVVTLMKIEGDEMHFDIEKKRHDYY